MKKIVLLSVSFLLVSCSANPKVEETIEPTITPEIMEDPLPRVGSKINIDLYPTEKYYPVVNGEVIYSDGTTEEFLNGEMMEDIYGDTPIGTKYLELYQEWMDKPFLEEVKETCYGNWRESGEQVTACFRQMLLEGEFPVWVRQELPEGYSFSKSIKNENGVIDGILGIEYTNNKGEIFPYVAYRYSNHVPEGYEINEAFRIYYYNGSFSDIPEMDYKLRISHEKETSQYMSDYKVYYVWRFKEYDEFNEFDGLELDFEGFNSREYALNWLIAVEGGTTVNLFTFK